MSVDRPFVCLSALQTAVLISLGRRYLIIVERTSMQTAISLYDDRNINRHQPSPRGVVLPLTVNEPVVN